MLLFIFLVALLNLGLGFAVAVYLAQYCPNVGAHGESSQPLLPGLPNGFSPVEEPAPTGPQPPEPPPELLSGLTAFRQTGQPTPESHNEPPQSEAAALSQASVAAIEGEVQRYDEQLSQLDDEFRNSGPKADAEWFQDHVQSLGRTNDEYLSLRNEAYESFESLHRAAQRYERICDVLEETMALQTAKIHETNEAIEAYNFRGDLAEGCKRMAAETGKLTDVNDEVRDALRTALAGIARQDKWLQTSSLSMRADTLTGVASRAGLEAHLAEWWNKDPHHARPLSVALVDLDHFAKVNEAYHRKVGDEVLKAVARILADENQGKGLVARYSGQCFAVVVHDTEIRSTTSMIERVRQLVEMCCFLREEKEIRITFSGGVVQATPDDTAESLLDRAVATVREAKRYGRNRTFVHDGKSPAPVVPSNLALQQRQIRLEEVVSE